MLVGRYSPSNTYFSSNRNGSTNKFIKHDEPQTKKLSINPYNNSKVSFGCMFCALAAVAATDDGKKMLNGIIPNSFDYIGKAESKPNALLELLSYNATAQTPPIPFDAGNRTQFKTYAQLMHDYETIIGDKKGQLAAKDSIKEYLNENLHNIGLPESLRKKYGRFVDNTYLNILASDQDYILDQSNPFQHRSRNIYFLTSFNSDPTIDENISGSPDSDEIPREVYEDILSESEIEKLNLEFDKESGAIITHSVSAETRNEFASKMPVLPYGFMMTSSLKNPENGNTSILIEDSQNFKLMEDSNANIAGIERFIATLIDPNINIETRPEKFDIYITSDLMNRLPLKSQELLKRPLCSEEEIQEETVRILKELNSDLLSLAQKTNPDSKALEIDKNKISDSVKAERIKAVLTVIKYFERSLPEKAKEGSISVYPQEVAALFEKATNKITMLKGLGFVSSDPENHTEDTTYQIEIDMNDKEAIKTLLSNLRTGLTENRNVHIGGNITDDEGNESYQECDPAFVKQELQN